MKLTSYERRAAALIATSMRPSGDSSRYGAGDEADDDDDEGEDEGEDGEDDPASLPLSAARAPDAQTNAPASQQITA